MVQLDRENLQRLTDDAISSVKNVVALMLVPLSIPLFFCQESLAYLKEITGVNRRSLEGQVVLITGASSGIGESLAKLFYEAGCRLILASRRKDELERVKNDLVRGRTTGTVYIPAVLELDLNLLQSIPDKCKTAIDIYGRIDILVNNAGVSYRGTVLETEMEVHQRIMNVNYFGALAVTRAIVNSMVENKSGQVLFVSSIQGKISLPFRSAYAASKHALQALADSLRAEVSSSGVTVTVVNPGYVKTNLSTNALTGTGEMYNQMDATTESGYSSNYVAQQAVKALKRGEKEVFICKLLHRIVVFLRIICPNLYFYIMVWRAKKLQ